MNTKMRSFIFSTFLQIYYSNRTICGTSKKRRVKKEHIVRPLQVVHVDVVVGNWIALVRDVIENVVCGVKATGGNLLGHPDMMPANQVLQDIRNPVQHPRKHSEALC